MLQALIAPTMKTTQSPVVSIIITSNKLQEVGLFRGEQAAGHLFSTSPWFGFEIAASIICRPQCHGRAASCAGVTWHSHPSHDHHSPKTMAVQQHNEAGSLTGKRTEGGGGRLRAAWAIRAP